jgi:hypothetical protein
MRAKGSVRNPIMVLRFYLVHEKLFVLGMMGKNVSPESKDARRFFSSFSYRAPTRLTPPALRPLYYFSFDEGPGPEAPDFLGRTARIDGDVAWVDGVRGGKALRFNGLLSRMEYDRLDGLNFRKDSPFTFAGWIRTASEKGTILAHRSSKDDENMLLLRLENGRLQLRFQPRQNRLAVVEIHGPGRVSDNRWHHFALARNQVGQWILYLDGRPQGNAASRFSGQALELDRRALGCDPLGLARLEADHFLGDIDEFCIFSRALTAEEIQGLAIAP